MLRLQFFLFGHRPEVFLHLSVLFLFFRLLLSIFLLRFVSFFVFRRRSIFFLLLILSFIAWRRASGGLLTGRANRVIAGFVIAVARLTACGNVGFEDIWLLAQYGSFQLPGKDQINRSYWSRNANKHVDTAGNEKA